MTNERLHVDPDLDDVLDAFLAAGADESTLNTLVRRFPQFEGELTEFAASRTLMHTLQQPREARAVPDEELVARGMGVLQKLLGQEPAPLRGLLTEARARGLNPRQFRDAVGLGEGVLMKLDRCLIQFGSIPRTALEQIAAAIQRDVASVARYLQQGPTLAPTAAYRSEQAPRVAEPEPFASAVRSDPTMSQAERDRWLSAS